MTEEATIAARVLDAVVEAGLVTAEAVASARAQAADAAGAGRTLLERGLLTSDALGSVLEERLGFPRVDLESYAPDEAAIALVPAEVARANGLLPLFEIEGMLTVAISRPEDVFALDALGKRLGLEVDAVLADADEISDALGQHYPLAEERPAPPVSTEPVASDEDFFETGHATPVVSEAPGDDATAGEPAAPAQTVDEVVAAETGPAARAIDLDVLAVADERAVALLVTSILELAVQRGANRIHLLPYKSDFFLVFRVKGRLEKVASAPLSMQPPLIEGFKAFARLGDVPPNRPALGRVHADVAGRSLVLTVSSVPTVAGQRLVVSIAAQRPAPRGLTEIGLSEAESRALRAMVERGRGILLIVGPVGGGRSTTYYALLDHAAQVGKTVYSVERSIEHEIPAVAQVLVSPGQPIPAAGYFAAGMRQDTDVLAIDAMQSVEEVHLAIEAAGLGKLVIATFSGGDIVSGVRRLLDLGAEPVSLASALTLGVGQRLVRTNCPNCSIEEMSPLVTLIPGVTAPFATRRGTGCPNCHKTGFAGATGIFEVLPFTEPVRSVIARGASAADIESAAIAAGMRQMIASGLTKVREGIVSPEELNRVMRFAPS